MPAPRPNRAAPQEAERLGSGAAGAAPPAKRAEAAEEALAASLERTGEEYVGVKHTQVSAGAEAVGWASSGARGGRRRRLVQHTSLLEPPARPAHPLLAQPAALLSACFACRRWLRWRWPLLTWLWI